MQLSLSGAQKTAQESKKLGGFSKQWLPGDTLRVFYPLMNQDGQLDIAVGAVWGHKVNDYENIGLKTIFIPSLTDVDEETGFPIGQPDVTYQFSQIAPVFIHSQHKQEEQKLQAKPWASETARAEAIKKLDHKYDAKNNMKAIKPAIGRLTYLIFTEVLVIKCTNGIPDPNTAAVVSYPISSEKGTKISTLLKDPKYAPQPGDSYFELEWKFPSNPDRATSSRTATVNGLTSENRLCNENPEVFNAIKNQLPMLSCDAETIARRATRKVSEPKIRQALMNYMFSMSEYLDTYIEDDEEVLLKHADLIQDLSVLNALTNESLIGKLKEELNNKPVEEATSLPKQNVEPTAPTTGMAPGIEEAPDLGAVAPPVQAATPAPAPEAPAQTATASETAAPAVDVSHVTGAPTIDGLMNNTGFETSIGDEEMEQVDLDMM